MRWGQLGNPSSHWTTGLSDYWFVAALTALTVFHLWLSAHLPPAEDELYYWAWSRSLHWSYYDHPPLVAYLIRLSTGIFGNTLFGIRFFACVIGSLTLALMSLLAPSRMILGYVLLTPLFFLGAVVMTPDIPLVFFWVLYALWLININHTLSQWNDDPITRVYRQMPVSWGRWFLGGVVLGLGCLGKYTMLLAIPCSGMALLSKYRGKAWTTGFIFHLLVAFAVCLPVLLFNVQHDFTPFRFQWAHAMGSFELSFKGFFEFIGGQILLVGALPFLLLPSVLLKTGELCANPRLQICYHLFLIPIFFFLLQAAKSPLEANWPIVSYLTFWALAQRLNDQNSFHLVRRTVLFISFLVPIAISILGTVHLLSPLKFVRPERDRIARLAAQYDLSRDIGRDLKELAPKDPVVATTYQWTSYLRFQGIDAQQVYPEGRASQYTLDAQPTCSNAAVVAFEDANYPPSALRCFPKHEMLRKYTLQVRGRTIGSFQLTRYSR